MEYRRSNRKSNQGITELTLQGTQKPGLCAACSCHTALFAQPVRQILEILAAAKLVSCTVLKLSKGGCKGAVIVCLYASTKAR